MERCQFLSPILRKSSWAFERLAGCDLGRRSSQLFGYLSPKKSLGELLSLAIPVSRPTGCCRSNFACLRGRGSLAFYDFALKALSTSQCSRQIRQ